MLCCVYVCLWFVCPLKISWKIQVSNGGAAFFAGKSINNKEPKEQASIAGAVAMALHVRQMAKFYGIPVVLHSDHCAKKLLPWFDGMLQADEVSVERCPYHALITLSPCQSLGSRYLSKDKIEVPYIVWHHCVTRGDGLPTKGGVGKKTSLLLLTPSCEQLRSSRP